jgi:hypothetical protein
MLNSRKYLKESLSGGKNGTDVPFYCCDDLDLFGFWNRSPSKAATNLNKTLISCSRPIKHGLLFLARQKIYRRKYA